MRLLHRCSSLRSLPPRCLAAPLTPPYPARHPRHQSSQRLPPRHYCPAVLAAMAMSARLHARPLTLPLPSSLLRRCPVNEHAASDNRSATRCDAAVAPNGPAVHLPPARHPAIIATPSLRRCPAAALPLGHADAP